MRQAVLTVDAVGAAVAPRSTAAGHARRLGRLLACWLQRYRQRRALARLDDHLLRDIGVTAEEAAAEAAKPFWRS